MKPSIWAIFNLTPDSFSDGGSYNSVASLEESLKKRFKCSDVYDFGAESTAPFNDPISSKTELKRFKETLIPLFQSRPELFATKVISIDTYRAEIFDYIATLIREHLDCRLVWNDVSGIFDKDVIDIMEKHKCYYVLSHNRAPRRELTSSHMDYVLEGTPEELLDDIIDSFHRSIKLCPDELRAKLVLDPCFGFSKNYEQNIYLLTHIDQLMSRFSDHLWLIGISRKSFLKKQLEELEIRPTNEDLDALQTNYLKKWSSSLSPYQWDIRTHAPQLARLVFPVHKRVMNA